MEPSASELNGAATDDGDSVAIPDSKPRPRLCASSKSAVDRLLRGARKAHEAASGGNVGAPIDVGSVAGSAARGGGGGDGCGCSGVAAAGAAPNPQDPAACHDNPWDVGLNDEPAGWKPMANGWRAKLSSVASDDWSDDAWSSRSLPSSAWKAGSSWSSGRRGRGRVEGWRSAWQVSYDEDTEGEAFGDHGGQRGGGSAPSSRVYWNSSQELNAGHCWEGAGTSDKGVATATMHQEAAGGEGQGAGPRQFSAAYARWKQESQGAASSLDSDLLPSVCGLTEVVQQPQQPQPPALQVDLTQALCFETSRTFLLGLEVELQRLLEAPRGAALRLPTLAPPYFSLLLAACRRCGAQVSTVEVRGTMSLDIVATEASVDPLPLAALVPGTWAGDSPSAWRMTSDVHCVKKKKPYLEMVMHPGVNFQPFTSQAATLGDGEFTPVGASGWRMDGELGPGVVVELAIDNEAVGGGVAFIVSSTADAESGGGGPGSDFIVRLRPNVADGDDSWSVEATGAAAADARRSVPWPEGGRSRFWLAISRDAKACTALIEVGYGTFPSFRLVQRSLDLQAPPRLGVVALPSSGAAALTLRCDLRIERGLCPDRARQDHIARVEWEEDADADAILGALGPGVASTTVALLRSGPRSALAVCESGAAALALCGRAIAAGCVQAITLAATCVDDLPSGQTIADTKAAMAELLRRRGQMQQKLGLLLAWEEG